MLEVACVRLHGADPQAPRIRYQCYPRARDQAGVAAAAVGAGRGDPACPGWVPRPWRQGRDHRPARPRGPEHRQGRRRPPAADPGLLRAPRRPDPLPARTSRGRVSAPRPAGREAAPKSVPRPLAAW